MNYKMQIIIEVSKYVAGICGVIAATLFIYDKKILAICATIGGVTFATLSIFSWYRNHKKGNLPRESKKNLKKIIDNFSKEKILFYLKTDSYPLRNHPYTNGKENLYYSKIFNGTIFNKKEKIDLVKIDIFKEHYAQLCDVMTLIYFFHPKSNFTDERGEILEGIKITINKCKLFMEKVEKNEKEFMSRFNQLDQNRLPDLKEKALMSVGLIIVGSRDSLKKADLEKMKKLNADYFSNRIFFATYNWLLYSVNGDSYYE